MLEFLIPLLVGGVSSWYGSQVGGGGILFLSYLLWAGIPPQIALGTHRSVVVFGRLSATIKYIKSQQVDWIYVPLLASLYLIGSFIGTRVFLSIQESVLNIIMIIGLILPLLAIGLKKGLGDTDKKVSLLQNITGAIGLCAVAAWGTIMSPGAGILALLVMSFFLGMSFVRAKATTVVAGIPSSIYATWFMWTNDFVDLPQFWPAALGYIIGAWFGASFAIKSGNSWLKKLIVGVTLASLVKIIFF